MNKIKNALLIIFVLTASFLWGYGKITAVQNEYTVNFGEIRCNGCGSGGNVRSTQVTDPNLFQIWQADWNTSYQGFGALGPSGGKYGVDGCLNSNGAMWSGSCWALVDSNGAGNIGNSAGYTSHTRDIGGTINNFTYAVGSYYVNDAAVYPQIKVYGRQVSINGFNTTNPVPMVGQYFDVTWDASERTQNTVLTYTGPITCDVPDGYSTGSNGDGTTCVGTGIGVANFHLHTYGYSGTGGKDADDDLAVNIISPGMVNLNFNVKDQNNSNISGATVTINRDFGNGVTRSTNGSGNANFGVDKNVSVGWTVTASGCSSSSGTANIGGSDVLVNAGLNCAGGAPPGGGTSAAAGVLEAANCTTISGYAGDPDSPGSEIMVYLVKDANYYSGGTVLDGISTSIFRPDVNAAYGITGNHGFSFATPDSLKDGVNHAIYVHPYDIGGTGPNTPIANSGIVINCPRPVTTPAVTLVDVPTSVTPNGSTQYSFIVTATDSGGGNKIDQVYSLIQSPGRSPAYSGYLTWGAGNYWPSDKNNQACSGGGFAAIQSTGGNTVFGHGYLNLVSCSTTVSGNTRTTTFTVNFNTTFTTPLTGNFASGVSRNTDGNWSPWVNSAPFFLNMPTVTSVTISPTPVNPNASTQYTIQTVVSDPSGGANINQVYSVINFQGSNVGSYRGSLLWSTANNWPSFKNNQACSGGGFAAVSNLYNPQYVVLVSCSTSISGSSRTVNYVVRFDPLFKSDGPLIDNDISGFAYNAFNHGSVVNGYVDWYNPNQNFSLAVNNAQYVSQTVPTTMTPGQVQSVSVVMRNTGTNVWTQAGNYKLGTQNPADNTTFGISRVLMSGADSIAKDSTKTFTFNITAPSTPGTYNFQWKMIQEGVEWFGDTTPNVAITVANATFPDLTAGAVTPTTATAGSATSFTSTITNSGSASTGASFNNLFQVATASNGGGTVSTISVNSNATLGAGASSAVTSSSYSFPSAGIYSVRACADNNSSMVGAITESNEGNNCGAWTNITVSAAATPTISASPSSIVYNSGVSATVTFNNIPTPTNTDWIGVFVQGNLDTAYANWLYTSSCTQTPNASTPSNGSCTFPMPYSAGVYDFRIFSNDGWARIVPTPSNTVTITNGVTDYLLTVSANPGPGGSVTGTGINCGVDCTENISAGTTMDLTAVPASSFWKLNTWTGCDVVIGNICRITVNSNRNVNASFVRRLFQYKEF